jgi:hypothetical protein
MPRLPTPWIKPTSLDLNLFVNRKVEVKHFVEDLGDMVDYGTRTGIVTVRGDRGVGKSIFVREVLRQVEEKYEGKVLIVSGDLRATNTRQMLVNLVDHLLAAIDKSSCPALGNAWRKSWASPLQDLRMAGDRLIRSNSSVEGRDYGLSSEVGGGLYGLLTGKFAAQWKEKREAGSRTDSTLEITSDVLRVALVGTLEALAKHVTVFVFFDDFDQAIGMDNPEAAKGNFRAVLDIQPCVSIIHLRTEVAGFAELRREAGKAVTVSGLGPKQLVEIIDKRSNALPGLHHDQLRLPSARAPFAALASATDNPLVLLRWAQGLATRHREWPPEPSWTNPTALRDLSVDSAVAEIEAALWDKLGAVIDRLGVTTPLNRKLLLEGKRGIDPTSAVGLSEDELAWLERYEHLVPIDRFDTQAGLRLDPLLRLIVPSIAANVRAAFEGSLSTTP